MLLVGGVVAYLAEAAGQRAGERDAARDRQETIPTTTLLPVTTTTTASTTTTSPTPPAATATTAPGPAATTTSAPAGLQPSGGAAGDREGRREMPNTGAASRLLPGLAGLVAGAVLAGLRAASRPG